MWAAKRLLASVLSSVLDEYVESDSIDSENLNVDVMKGELHLENLVLRPNALDSLGLPLKLVRGLIGRVKITGANLGTVRCAAHRLRCAPRSRALPSPPTLRPPTVPAALHGYAARHCAYQGGDQRCAHFARSGDGLRARAAAETRVGEEERRAGQDRQARARAPSRAAAVALGRRRRRERRQRGEREQRGGGGGGCAGLEGEARGEDHRQHARRYPQRAHPLRRQRLGPRAPVRVRHHRRGAPNAHDERSLGGGVR